MFLSTWIQRSLGQWNETKERHDLRTFATVMDFSNQLTNLASCDNLMVPNAKVVHTCSDSRTTPEWPVDAVANVRCDDGYALKAHSSAKCVAKKGERGKWDNPPECIKTCAKYETTGALVAAYSNAVYIVGTRITLSCNDGHQLEVGVTAALHPYFQGRKIWQM